MAKMTIIRYGKTDKGFAVVLSLINPGRNEMTMLQEYEVHREGDTMLINEEGFSTEEAAITAFDSLMN